MSELIGGKEALIAFANGEMVEMREKDITRDWNDVHKSMMLSAFEGGFWEFRLKPRTIIINGIEVPAPFEPKRDEPFYVLNAFAKNGYQCFRLSEDYDLDFENALVNFVWRTEDEIKQVVEALRSNKND